MLRINCRCYVNTKLERLARDKKLLIKPNVAGEANKTTNIDHLKLSTKKKSKKSGQETLKRKELISRSGSLTKSLAQHNHSKAKNLSFSSSHNKTKLAPLTNKYGNDKSHT